MRSRQLLLNMMQSVAQRASRNKTWYMQKDQPEPEYPADDAPLTDQEIQQILNTVRTKYA